MGATVMRTVKIRLSSVETISPLDLLSIAITLSRHRCVIYQQQDNKKKIPPPLVKVTRLVVERSIKAEQKSHMLPQVQTAAEPKVLNLI